MRRDVKLQSVIESEAMSVKFSRASQTTSFTAWLQTTMASPTSMVLMKVEIRACDGAFSLGRCSASLVFKELSLKPKKDKRQKKSAIAQPTKPNVCHTHIIQTSRRLVDQLEHATVHLITSLWTSTSAKRVEPIGHCLRVTAREDVVLFQSLTPGPGSLGRVLREGARRGLRGRVHRVLQYGLR